MTVTIAARPLDHLDALAAVARLEGAEVPPPLSLPTLAERRVIPGGPYMADYPTAWPVSLIAPLLIAPLSARGMTAAATPDDLLSAATEVLNAWAEHLTESATWHLDHASAILTARASDYLHLSDEITRRRADGDTRDLQDDEDVVTFHADLATLERMALDGREESARLSTYALALSYTVADLAPTHPAARGILVRALRDTLPGTDATAADSDAVAWTIATFPGGARVTSGAVWRAYSQAHPAARLGRSTLFAALDGAFGERPLSRRGNEGWTVPAPDEDAP